ncbi:unnamed protein product [Rotaria sp. Silwood2]|nr:unnamed protein product [Rotaria sp. Silwood2]CAF4520145.1 unnamed protein product [Rotaria sp. Silwood2]
MLERHFVDIAKYREKILHQQNDEINNDIPFQKVYRSLLTSTIRQPFISAIFHLDGVPLGKSNKLTLWVLSCSILELPPSLRNRHSNMIVLSMWVGVRQPIIKLWLRLSIRDGQKWFLYFVGIIGDCPALKLALNHIGNNGYHCCWFCKIEGIHIGKKRQYPFEETPTMRSINSYINESKEAEVNGTNVNGHLGISFFNEILDVPLPHGILMDYMHITLLRHTRCVVLQIYQSFSPKIRIEIDNKLRFQKFPHTFNRKLRPINAGHINSGPNDSLILSIDYPMDKVNESLGPELYIAFVTEIFFSTKTDDDASSAASSSIKI